MAKAAILFSKVQKWEGGFSNHKADKGGNTNMGITLKTWQSMGYDKDDDGDIDLKDLKLIAEGDVFDLFKKHYWDKCSGDFINSQSIANMLVDWSWNSGPVAIKRVQRLLNLKEDAIIGPKTLASINQANYRNLFHLIKEERIRFVKGICERDPSQNVFLRGWLNRIEDFVFEE